MTTPPSIAWAHPLVQEWFVAKFGAPTEPQAQGWPSILSGQTTLISAPTGSGKTFAAFLACLNDLVIQSLAGTLTSQTQVLYVSPLKALGNDIQKNLLQPLAEMTALAQSKNLPFAEIQVAVRTGDTLTKERVAMLKKPPHILITTPESLYILLTAEKSRAMLSTVKTVIVDEIHAMAQDKRGAHLLLSLERLEALTQAPPVRIGLSATQKPLELVGHYLAGSFRPAPVIVNIGHARQLELAIEVPAIELGAVASNEMWDDIYDKLATFAQENRSTLIFVNTRRLAERVAHHLSQRLGEDWVTAHHGSLSRKLRLEAETKLKNGELKALVATASLELGIDIGSIDLVCQIGSPRAIAAALQRVGRAGHWHGAISKGRFFVTTRDELLECSALVKAIQEGDLDTLIIPHQPMDILAQQIVASCATGDWDDTELYERMRGAYPYQDLTRQDYDAVIAMLAEGLAGSRGRYGAYLFHDKVNHLLKARRGARLTAITSGGAIPENGLFTVIAEPQGGMVGTLDEEFAVESNRGDIILLGTSSWQIKRIEAVAGRVLVEDAHGAPPSVPFWQGEAPGRTQELSWYVAHLRQAISERLPNSTSKDVPPKPEVALCMEWLKQSCGLKDYAAQQLVQYVLTGRDVLGAVPTQTTIIAERFFDEAGGMQLIIHAPFGARINKAWGLALRKRFCRSFNFELQAAATDDGLNIALAEQHSFPLGDVFHFLHPNTIKEVLLQAVLQSPLFKIRWRWTATRALALLRFRGGKKIPPNIQRMLSDDLLAAVFPDAAACQDNLAGEDINPPDHPLINETLKDAMTQALDTDGLSNLLTNILNESIQCLAVDTPLPSVFSHEILNANPYAFLDDAPLEERRARAVDMRRMLPDSVLHEVGKLDPLAIQEVQNQAWPDIRNADELHDLLQTLIVLPIDSQALPRPTQHWHPFYQTLVEQGRIAQAKVAQHTFWVAAEKVKTAQTIFPDMVLQQPLLEISEDPVEQEQALVHAIRGWMTHLGPTSAVELSELLGLPMSTIDQALLQLEFSGFVLRGYFGSFSDEQTQWCERRLLARIHRITVDTLRRQIEPVTPAQFMQWLLKWQHVAPGTQVNGEQGLIQVIQQLQGFECPANVWERQILQKRVLDYNAFLLDKLCLMGVVSWGRLGYSPDPESTKKIAPRSDAPITFFLREDLSWLPRQHQFVEDEHFGMLGTAAKQVFGFLQQKGASFLADIVRGVGRLQVEVEGALWELVAAGAITADGFDNLRALIDPKRRLNKHRRRAHFHYSSGRWTLLEPAQPMEPHLQLESICWMLLKRYGVVFRDLLAREKNIPRWREILLTLRRLEARGEVRGGRFVSGFMGEQFALPYAVESLRAMKQQGPLDEAVLVAAADPLNLVGIIVPGEKVAIKSGKKVEL